MIAGSGAAAAKGLKSMREDGATEVAATGAASEGSKEQAEVAGDASGDQAAGAGDAGGSRDIESLARAVKGALFVAAESGELEGLLEACATRRSQPADGSQQDEGRKRSDPSRFTTEDIRERNANLPSTQRAFPQEEEPVSGDLCMEIQGALPLAVLSGEGSVRGQGSGEQAAGAGDARGSREGMDIESLARAVKGALFVATESGELEGLLEACVERRSQPADGSQQDEGRKRFDPNRFTTEDIRERNANLPSTQRAFPQEEELGSTPTTASRGTPTRRSQPADGEQQDESQITVIVD